MQKKSIVVILILISLSISIPMKNIDSMISIHEIDNRTEGDLTVIQDSKNISNRYDAESIIDWFGEDLIADIYVDDNADPGWYDATHVRTIPEGINNASVGDTVYVYNGTYYESIVINKKINLIGENKNSTIIDGYYIEHPIDDVLINSNGVTLSGFMIRNSANELDASGIRIWGNNTYIYNNNISYNANNGIYIMGTSNNTISNNIISNNHLGILITNFSWSDNYITIAHNNSILNNIFYYDGLTIYNPYYPDLINIYDNFVFNNTVNGKPLVYLENVSNLTVNDAGEIVLLRCNNITVQNLNISSVDFGINLLESENCSIKNNNVSSNLCGMFLFASKNNIITGNNIFNNDGGILLYYSFDNLIYNNYFNNSGNAYEYSDIFWNITGHNFWNITKTYGINIVGGPFLCGNYWSDYTGVDANGDGIGDTPYNIPSGDTPGINNKDFYPLMLPCGPPYAIITFTSNQSIVYFNSSYSYDYDGNIVSYYWDFGEGNISYENNPIHNYSVDAEYNVTLTVTDNDGNNQSTYLILIVHTNPMMTGWNLISIPTQTSWWASDVLNNLTCCTQVARWNASLQSYDKVYFPGAPPTFNFQIEHGQGYFVEMNYSENLTLIGYKIANVSIPMKIGWNLVGWYHDFDTMASSLLGNITNCTQVARWNATLQSYDKVYFPGAPPTFDFIVTCGMGLFVEVSEESVWYGEG